MWPRRVAYSVNRRGLSPEHMQPGVFCIGERRDEYKETQIGSYSQDEKRERKQI